MMRHTQFEWDAAKARSNAKKHGVRFEQAMRVLGDEFADRFHVEEADVEHSDEEDRYLTTGSDPYARDIVLIVSWTDRQGTTRIISARPVTRSERNDYEVEIQRRLDRP
jgi:uncharacterized protein